MRVLVVEDEIRLAENIAVALREGPGFAVDCAHNGHDGMAMAESGNYDLISLDLMLPGIDGLTITKNLRARGDKTPILVLKMCIRDSSQATVQSVLEVRSLKLAIQQRRQEAFPKDLRSWVADRAEEGDARAAAQLRGWRYADQRNQRRLNARLESDALHIGAPRCV